MRWWCIFFDHYWWHVLTIANSPDDKVGLYQCRRCKEISIGSPSRMKTQ